MAESWRPWWEQELVVAMPCVWANECWYWQGWLEPTQSLQRIAAAAAAAAAAAMVSLVVVVVVAAVAEVVLVLVVVVAEQDWKNWQTLEVLPWEQSWQTRLEALVVVVVAVAKKNWQILLVAAAVVVVEPRWRVETRQSCRPPVGFAPSQNPPERSGRLEMLVSKKKKKEQEQPQRDRRLPLWGPNQTNPKLVLAAATRRIQEEACFGPW